MPEPKYDVSDVIVELFEDRLIDAKQFIERIENSDEILMQPTVHRFEGRMEELEAILAWFDGKEIVEKEPQGDEEYHNRLADKLEEALEEAKVRE